MKRAISQQQKYSSFNKVLIQLLKQLLKKIKKTLDTLTSVEILSLSFFSRVKRATNVAPMLTNNNMEDVHARETI